MHIEAINSTMVERFRASDESEGTSKPDTPRQTKITDPTPSVSGAGVKLMIRRRG